PSGVSSTLSEESISPGVSIVEDSGRLLELLSPPLDCEEDSTCSPLSWLEPVSWLEPGFDDTGSVSDSSLHDSSGSDSIFSGGSGGGGNSPSSPSAMGCSKSSRPSSKQLPSFEELSMAAT